MTKRKLFISGRGVSVALPADALRSLNMAEDSSVDVSVRDGTIHLRPRPITRVLREDDVADTSHDPVHD